MLDYQIQTTASDGKYSPRECVKMAKDAGLISIAITDHDTVGGIEEALVAGKQLDIEVLSGIEISCDYLGYGIHLLGLGLDHKHAPLLELLKKFREVRITRVRDAVGRLQALGFEIDFERVRARAQGVIARPHVADEIMENPLNAAKLKKEGIVTKKDLFNAYLGDEARNKVFEIVNSFRRLSAEEAIRYIHEAGGIAVWSHPTLPIADYRTVEDALQKFIGFGMEGIEAIGNFSEDDTEFLNTLAGKYTMLRTAGSDFHDTSIDPAHPEEGAARIGGYKTFGFSIEGIREGVISAIAKRSPARF